MSKRIPRSKKGDGNVPNFVFQLGGDASGTPPNFNFSPGTPASPSTSNFTLSNSTSPATGGFNFGGTVNSPTTSIKPLTSPSSQNSTFAFNTSAGSLKRQQSDAYLAPNKKDSSGIRRTTSEVSFGTGAATTPPTTFTFGALPSNTSASAFNFPKPASTAAPTSTNTGASTSFTPQTTFGSPAATTTSTSSTTTNTPKSSTQSAFTFAVPTTPASAKVQSAFSFTPPSVTTKTASTAATTEKTSTTPAFSFPTSTSSTASASTPKFSFGTAASTGSTTVKPTTPTSSAFNIGAKVTDNTTNKDTTNKPAFSFGSTAATTSSPLTASKSTEPPKASTSTAAKTFMFGSKTTDDIKKTTPSVSFGSASTTTSKPTTASGTTTPSFTFGAATSATTATTTTSTPSFTFGATASSTSTSTATATTSTPALTFGVSTGATTKETPKFTFGTDKKDDKTATATSSPFTFGATAPVNTTTPAASATIVPEKPNVFSFAKLLEDLEKTATQPAGQIYATLIPPPLAGLPQGQAVHLTNFRIDNILPSTRFTELPEQAQKELDEVERYIRLENQRFEYIASHKIQQHHDTAAEIKKQIESLTQKLDAVDNMLKGQKESIESLYDTIKEQLRHANDGSVVTEACKHPGNNARWLFGYTEEDDYFSQLSKQLSSRMEEYKKCIWEVERTAEAWTQNKVQSPQDIANIMRAQNVTFLALSNKVASLHESVSAEKNNYSRYLRMYN